MMGESESEPEGEFIAELRRIKEGWDSVRWKRGVVEGERLSAIPLLMRRRGDGERERFGLRCPAESDCARRCLAMGESGGSSSWRWRWR